MKSAVQLYVDFVFSQGLLLTELADPFVAIFFYRDVKNASVANFPGSDGHHIKLSRKVVSSIGVPCAKAGWKVDTQGNPSSSTTKDVLASVGLDPTMQFDAATWSTMQVFLDSQILKDRHKIAHGERFPIDAVAFNDRSDRIIVLCEHLSGLVRAAALNRAYRRN